MKLSTSLKIMLLQYFSIYTEVDLLYITNQGAVFTEEKLENAVELFGLDNIRIVTRADIMMQLTRNSSHA
jgi:hypothetical protein